MLNDKGVELYYHKIILQINKKYFSFLDPQADELW